VASHTHCPATQSCPTAQAAGEVQPPPPDAGAHTPFAQTPLAQDRPHTPQLAASVCVFVHTAPHDVCPAAHVVPPPPVQPM